MKSYLIIWVMLGTYTMCRAMDTEKIHTKTISILNHEGVVKKIISTPHYPYLILCLQNDTKNDIEIYDTKDKKNIAKINAITGTIIPNACMPWVVAYIHERNNDNTIEDVCSLFDISTQSTTTYPLNKHSKIGPCFAGEKNTFFLLSSSVKKNTYRVIDLENNTEKITAHKSPIEECLMSPNKEYIYLYGKDDGSRMQTFSKNEINKLSEQQLSLQAFNQDSSLFTFFESKTKKLQVYNLKDCKIISEYCLKNNIEQLLFCNNKTIVFCCDSKKYYAWKPLTEKPSYIPLDKTVKEKISFFINTDASNNEYIIFTSDNHTKNIIYNSNNDVLECFDIEGFCTQSIITKNLWPVKGDLYKKPIQTKYALFCSTFNGAYLYRTSDWGLIKFIDLSDKALNPWAYFSPCENFIIMYSHALKELYIYDLEKESFVLNTQCVTGLTCKNFCLYSDKNIIFAPTNNSIMIYNYENYQRKKVKINEKIARFAVHNTTLIISSLDKKTEFVELDIIKKKESKFSPLMQNQIYRVKEKKIEDEKSDKYIFYDKDGTLITIEKKDNTRYCTIQ